MSKFLAPILITLALTVLNCNGKGNSPYSNSWSEFKAFHNKRFENSTLELIHKAIFLVNALSVAVHNVNFQNGLVSYERELNKFGDADDSELASLRGYIAPSDKFLESIKKATSEDLVSRRQTIPTSFDWRDYNVVSPVKNQGGCGSCWAFTANGALESQQYLKSKTMKTFSEQQLVDCDYGDGACNGGHYVTGWKYIVKNKGVQSDASYPYTVGNAFFPSRGSCKFSSTQQLQTMTSSVMVAQNETTIMEYLYNVGPLAMAMDATNLASYSSGIYTCSGTVRLNHAVLLVGYGVSSSNVPYWIVKNSWGTSWGVNGYFYLRRGTNACGVAADVHYPII